MKSAAFGVQYAISLGKIESHVHSHLATV